MTKKIFASTLGAMCLVLLCVPTSAWFWNDLTQRAKSKITEARFNNVDGVNGYIRFESLIKDNKPITNISYALTGLQGNVNLYHVHERKPIDSKNITELCGPSSTGGHYNPNNIIEMLKPMMFSDDKYEAGDLSGKHGPLNQITQDNGGTYSGWRIEKILTVEETLGRSVVFHKNNGKRWVCAAITLVS